MAQQKLLSARFSPSKAMSGPDLTKVQGLPQIQAALKGASAPVKRDKKKLGQGVMQALMQKGNW